MTKSREIRTKILKIMDLALKISPPDRQRRDNEPTVFVHYAAHCSMLEVRIHKKGWARNSVPDKEFYILTDLDVIPEELDETIEYLRNLREDTENEQN